MTNPSAHRIIEDYGKDVPFLELQEHCYNAMEALQYLNRHAVDLMFLDINMPKLKGFDFLKTLANPPKVIVTTAYKEFAIEGYELNVVDYLLKPFAFQRFVQAVNKVVELQQAPEQPAPLPKEPAPANQRLFLKGDKKYHQIRTNDILYVEAYGNYSKVYFTAGMIITHEKDLQNGGNPIPRTFPQGPQILPRCPRQDRTHRRQPDSDIGAFRADRTIV